ncbi:ankyrin [Stipitochalara longipes BDJ]|nr:ankyrin [Stipitochalara longipes BDJ]
MTRILPGAKEVIERSVSLAAEHGHVHIFSFLLDQGVPITARVAAAAFRGDKVEFCQALTEHGWEPQPQKVHILSVLSSEIALKWVLEHGWNPNLYGHNDIHPMTVAAASFPPSIVKILLDHGVCTRGTMAMHAAASMAADDPTRFEVLDLLLLYDGDVDEMEVDPKGRNPPRQRTSFTGTPLHHAIKANSVEAVRYLLERGASPTAPSWSGENALRLAERSGKVKIAETIRSLSPPDYSTLFYQ